MKITIELPQPANMVFGTISKSTNIELPVLVAKSLQTLCGARIKANSYYGEPILRRIESIIDSLKTEDQPSSTSEHELDVSLSANVARIFKKVSSHFDLELGDTISQFLTGYCGGYINGELFEFFDELITDNSETVEEVVQ